MMFEGVAGIAEIVILGMMLASAIVFAIMDIKTREVGNKWLKLYAGCMLIPTALAYGFDYIPNLGWWCLFYIAIGIGIPYLWWYFMRKWIGPADCKWLMITFVALPELVIVFIVLMIIFTLINFVIFKLRDKRELMPEMVPIACSALVVCIISVIFALIS